MAVTSRMYAVKTHNLPNTSLLAKAFIPSSRDAFTNTFLSNAIHAGHDATHLADEKRRQARYTAAQMRGYSRTDASAMYLNRTLLVASPEQFRRLIAPATHGLESPNSLLDIGAGRGMATASMTAAMRLPAASVTVMEASAPLKRKLAAMGYVPRDDGRAAVAICQK